MAIHNYKMYRVKNPADVSDTIVFIQRAQQMGAVQATARRYTANPSDTRDQGCWEQIKPVTEDKEKNHSFFILL